MPPSTSANPDAPPGGRLRPLLLAVVLFGAVGLGAELALIEHWEGTPQLVPLGALAATLGSGAFVALRPRRGTVLAFRAVMGLTIVAGLVGVGFHLAGNLAFEREIVPDAALGALLWEAVRGATPLLAPGSLVQLGLVGLVLTWRHPALAAPEAPSRPPSPDASGEPDQPEEHR